MKKLLLFTSFTFSSIVLTFAQGEGSVFTATGRGGVATSMVTDYHSIGINPANLGLRGKFETKHVTFGLMEFNANAFAQGVTLKQLEKYLLDGTNLSPQEKSDAANLFSGNTMSASADLMWFGFAFQSDKLGGLAFSVNDYGRASGQMSQNFTNFAFSGSLATQYFDSLETNNGQHVINDPSKYETYYNSPYNGIAAGISTNGVSLGTVMKGTTLRDHYYRTINVAYGKEIFRNELITVSVGLGVKYVFGYYYVNVEEKDGVLQGNVADNPFFSGGKNNLNLPSQENKGNLLDPQGHGMGFDLGVTTTVHENIKLAASVVNIGGIKYSSDNTYTLKDTTVYKLAFTQESLDAFNKTVYWSSRSSFNVKLPTMLRMGASIALLEGKIEVGGDIIVPLNKEAGNLNKTIYALGGDLYVVRWFKVSTGMNIGGNVATSVENYKTHVNIPFGFTFIAGENGAYEFGMATRDLPSLLAVQGTSPNISFGMGFLRFRV